MITLRMVFRDENSKQFTISFANIIEDPGPSDVRVLVDKIIEHKSIFYSQPDEFVGAELVITNKVPLVV